MATWSTAYMNNLPDSAFLYIEPGGKKDDEGKTVPRSLRHLPFKDENGNLDAPHIRGDITRLSQEKTGSVAGEEWLTDALRGRLLKRAQALLEELNNRQNADDDLETVDLTGVEILATGGPVHGKGSPPEGDYWTTADLRAMAEAHAELHDGGELNPTVAVNPPKNKVGHIEQPAVGYLENLRVDKTGTRLLADVKAVPKKLASLIRAKAYRARSVDLSRITSQQTGKTYEWVVTGLAWLGARLPAVRTLDDVVALYEGDGFEIVRVVEYAVGDVVWDPEESFQRLRDRVAKALNGDVVPSRFWVRDISPTKALIEKAGDGDTEGFVAAFSIGQDGELEIAPMNEWVPAEQSWTEAARAFSRVFEAPADTRPMADLILNDEKQREVAEAFGIKPEDVSSEALIEAARQKRQNADDEPPADLVKRIEKAEKTSEETQRRLEESERGRVLDGWQRDGRFEPGQREEIARLYEADPEACRKHVESLPKNPDFAREFGADDNEKEPTEEERKLADEQEKLVVSALIGSDAGEVI